MEGIINSWLSIWIYVMLAIGMGLTMLVVKNRYNWTKINILCALGIVVLVLHVVEEWYIPGGLHYLYNVTGKSQSLSNYPMNMLSDMITNFSGVILGSAVLLCGGFRKPASIVIMLISGFEVLVHIVTGIGSMNIFGSYGQNLLYSPGLVTSLFGFLPICIALAKELFKRDGRPTWKQWIMGIAATICVMFLCVNLPEMLCADKDSPYKFSDRGYYERFAEEYEADHTDVIY